MFDGQRSREPAVATVEHAAGSPVTTELLYRRHSQRVLRYCLRCLRRPADAEDALQQTFLQAHRALDRGVEPAAEAAWLLSIARNVCLTRSDALRRRMSSEVSTDPDVIAEHAGAPRVDDDISAEVHAALATLPSRQRDALFLREWHELSYAEIARVLGTSESAVETLVFRARRNLARELEPMRRRRTLDLAGLFGWARTGFGSMSAKLAVGAAAATVTAGTAVTVVVERAPASQQAPRHAPAVAAAPAAPAAAFAHVHARPHVFHARAARAPHASRAPVGGASSGVPSSAPAPAAPAQVSGSASPPSTAPATPPPRSAPVEPVTPATTPPVAQAATPVQAATTTATSVVSQAAAAASSTVDSVAAAVAAAAPVTAPVTTVVSDTVDKTAATASQTADAAAQTVNNAASAVNTTVSKLLPGH